MQAILGLLLFSVLLTRASSLECESCTSTSQDCSGKRITCPSGADGCMKIVTGTGGVSITMKACTRMADCQNLQVGKADPTSGSLVKEIVCSKATPSSGSLLLALSGLLLKKILL
ncbi:phospholipase A2 inhibitor and Ly6/PLAUR domain-containing protein-like [Rhineura floridana]|uniref:phospholipase A2 inhibitor and Ly6/PLAUR domain-containing protein-like n=1 Tax=Rhineura floridana TaxID=261503 RepID=UPI002AC8420F|nr:phospholipase A2 inhibitor and Ly6/PLAUR domain-containing protein-like [Rhineura floridana]